MIMIYRCFYFCNRWYCEKFEDYPRQRKALIPFILWWQHNITIFWGCAEEQININQFLLYFVVHILNWNNKGKYTQVHDPQWFVFVPLKERHYAPLLICPIWYISFLIKWNIQHDYLNSHFVYFICKKWNISERTLGRCKFHATRIH